MPVKVNRPGCQVFLFKNVFHQDASARQSGLPDALDLTPFLGDGSVISVSKSIHSPLGSFTITLPDQPHPATLDTLYAYAEPMDVIEIYMAARPHEHEGGLPPVVMRGFVRHIARNEAMGDDGRPSRTVTISGADYGVAFNNLVVSWEKGYITGALILDRLQMYQMYQLGAEAALTGNDFMTRCTDIVNDYLAGLRQPVEGYQTRVLDVAVNATVSTGSVVMAQVQPYKGPIWNLMLSHADTPWNELFVREGKEQPELVYRQTPFIDLDGKSVHPDGPDSGELTITPVSNAALKQINISRSDVNVANFYWVEVLGSSEYGYMGLVNQKLNAERVEGNIYIPEYPNAAERVYGFRKMETRSSQIWDTPAPVQPAHERESKIEEYGRSLLDWAEYRRDVLVASNRDNVILEQGSAVIEGNPLVQAGSYVELERGGLYYATAVTHQFMPYRNYTTSLVLSRGTGFWARINSEASPYFNEGRGGIYGGTWF